MQTPKIQKLSKQIGCWRFELGYDEFKSNQSNTKLLIREDALTGKRNQHVVVHPEGWAVKGAGAQRATQVFDRKSNAVDRAREIAQNQGTELIINKKRRPDSIERQPWERSISATGMK